VLPCALGMLLCMGATQQTTVVALSDAFWQVATYVGLTLFLFYYVSSRLSEEGKWVGLLQRDSRLQVAFAACMGALPGCGGAIIVMTQFVRGRHSFGSVVAVLSATMGDAAFLLLASEPRSGAIVLIISWGIGMVYGWVVDQIHGTQFLRPQANVVPSPHGGSPSVIRARRFSLEGHVWRWVLVPSSLIAALGSLHYDVDAVCSLPDDTVNTVGAMLVMVTLVCGALRPAQSISLDVDLRPRCMPTLFNRVARETNFVLCWVVTSFLAFELFVLWAGFDLTLLLAAVPEWTILIAVCMGFLPGCGPQIMVATLYVSGLIPLSAQLGNAISNDGDALFPAIALAPKAATLATVYTAVPALCAAYGFYYLFE